MNIKFIADKKDKNACLALSILENLGQKTFIFEEDLTTVKIGPEKEETLIAVFTASEAKMIRQGHASRTASHRAMEFAPLWASSCKMLIAVTDNFGDINLKAMAREWIRIVSNLEKVDLASEAPWGPKPVGEKRFNLYKSWIEKHLGQNLENLNLRHVPRPIPNFNDTQIKEIRKELLKAKKDKFVIYGIVRTAQTTRNPVSVEKTILTGVKLLDLMAEKRILVESDLQIQKFLNCLWRAMSGEELKLIIPLCPAWTYDENGYNFCGLEENSRGVCYDMMSPELVYFLSFLKSVGVVCKTLIWVADIEWFDLEGGSYSTIQGAWPKEKFLSYVEKQCELVTQDLLLKGVNAEVRPLLKIFTEEEYLREQVLQEKTYSLLLDSSTETRKHFLNTLKLEAVLYKKQCGVDFVDYHNPDPKVKKALIKDMVTQLAPLVLFRKLYFSSNYLFFIQNGPFAQLYEYFPVPYVLWRVSRKGAF